jgi:hypothetical protein
MTDPRRPDLLDEPEPDVDARRLGRGLTEDELERALRRYPVDVC